MIEQEKVISRIRAGRSIGATTDDLYHAIVTLDGVDEGTFFLCHAAAILLGDLS